jgi:ribonuclease BN (tRNA processing enzyme)
VQAPTVVFEDTTVRVTAIAVTHGRAVPALAYRFDTPDGSVAFSGDTSVDPDLVVFARGADILVHHVADLGYLERHGFTGAALERMAALHTDVSEVGAVAEQAGVRELVLTHYLPAEPEAITPAQWAERARQGFRGRTIAGTDGQRLVLTQGLLSAGPPARTLATSGHTRQCRGVISGDTRPREDVTDGGERIPGRSL